MASLENEQDDIGRNQASAERSVSILWHPFYKSLLPGVGGFLAWISLCAPIRFTLREFEKWLYPFQYSDYEVRIEYANDFLESHLLYGTPWKEVLIGLALGGIIFEVYRRLIRHHHAFIVTRFIMTKGEKKKLGFRRHLQDLRIQWPDTLLGVIALMFALLYAGLNAADAVLSLIFFGAMLSGSILMYNSRRDIYLAAKYKIESRASPDAISDLSHLRFTPTQKICAFVLGAASLIFIIMLGVLIVWIGVLSEDLGVILLENLRAEASSNVGPPS